MPCYQLAIMKKRPSNNSHKSRLTRWVDIFLPFCFETKHLPGSRMSLIHYILLEPNQLAPNITWWGDKFVVAIFDLVKRSVKLFLLNEYIYAPNLCKLTQMTEHYPKMTSMLTTQKLFLGREKMARKEFRRFKLCCKSTFHNWQELVIS